MKLVQSIFVFTVMIFGMNSICAQMQSLPVEFALQRMQQNNQDGTMKLLMDIEFAMPGGTATGPGIAYMCNCYCDSIWEAWPGEVNNIPGTGTLYFVNSSDGGVPQGVQNGVLGIKMVEGGIERETEFRVATKFVIQGFE